MKAFTQDVENDEEFLNEIVSRIVQPASLELRTDKSCGTLFDIRAVANTLKRLNATFIYHTDCKKRNILQYTNTPLLRNLPGYINRYILIDGCLVLDISRYLKTLLYLFKGANIISRVRSMPQVTSTQKGFCSTIQLVWVRENNVTVLGLPGRTGDRDGCCNWRTCDESFMKKCPSFRLPCLQNLRLIPHSLKDAVIRGTCEWRCNKSDSINLLSVVHNFTITDCSESVLSCDFIESDDKRSVIGSVATGAALPLSMFRSEGFAFLAPKGPMYPKWKYLTRPLKLSAWLGLLSCVTITLVFFALSLSCRRSTLREARKQLWGLSEILVCSLFAPVPIPHYQRVFWIPSPNLDAVHANTRDRFPRCNGILLKRTAPKRSHIKCLGACWKA